MWWQRLLNLFSNCGAVIKVCHDIQSGKPFIKIQVLISGYKNIKLFFCILLVKIVENVVWAL
jgi:hypothetical protein